MSGERRSQALLFGPRNLGPGPPALNRPVGPFADWWLPNLFRGEGPPGKRVLPGYVYNLESALDSVRHGVMVLGHFDGAYLTIGVRLTDSAVFEEKARGIHRRGLPGADLDGPPVVGGIYGNQLVLARNDHEVWSSVCYPTERERLGGQFDYVGSLNKGKRGTVSIGSLWKNYCVIHFNDEVVELAVVSSQDRADLS